MRQIALLEFQPGLTAEITPPTSYLERTNGTLTAEACQTRIDQNGFMVSERPAPAGGRKILLLGGSAIENLFIPAPSRILSRIEEMCDMRGQPIKSYSAAISNAHLLHMINLLLNKGLGLRPDYVVYYPTPGLDHIANEMDNTFWNPMDGLTPVRKIGKDIQVGFLSSFPNKNQYADEKRLLHILCDICQRFNIRLLLATWPLYGRYDDYMQRQCPNRPAFNEEERQTALLNTVVRAVAAERDYPLIDLEQVFASLDHGDYFYDWNHPNKQGCEMIAAQTVFVLQSLFEAAS